MGSLAVTLKAIDAALIAKYTGITISVDSVVTAVTPFIEEPDPELYTERTFPSVAIKMISMVPDYQAVVDSEDDTTEETDYDAGVTPPERSMRQRPLPFRIMYSIDTWHKANVGESRDLVTEAVLYRTNPRGYLTVENIDEEDINVWMFWSGGVTTLDEADTDEMIYHKNLTVTVLAHLALVEADDVTDLPVATELQLSTYSRRTWQGEDGLEVDDTENVKDITIRVTDTDVDVIP